MVIIYDDRGRTEIAGATAVKRDAVSGIITLLDAAGEEVAGFMLNRIIGWQIRNDK